MLSRLTVAAGVCFAIYLGALLAGTVLLARILGVGGDGLYFNIQRWETEHVLGHLLYEMRVAVAGDDVESEDTLLARYFELNREISTLREELDTGGGHESEARRLDATLDERRDIENRVERILEERVGDAIRSLDLAEDLPIFDDFAPVWPPVSVELGEPPRVLALSPRDHIELLDSDLLKPDLSTEEILRIEQDSETGQLSALVEDTGGVGTYPSNVRHRTSYEDLLDVVAHEWTHQYLAFYPLGFNYFDNNELRTLNETVANVIGREVGQRAAELYPLDIEEPAQAPRTIDFRATMRALRLEVDDMLAAGEVGRAEERMEEARQELAQGGIYIRKINQAYFAYHGSYGDAPQSSSPIGPRVAELRGFVGSLQEFLEVIREVTSQEELDRALERLD